MSLDRTALARTIHQQIADERAALGPAGIDHLLDAGKGYDLGPTLAKGGVVIFPHAGLAECGHQIAAAVHSCLDSGARRVLVIGVLHALSDELEQARVRVAAGGDASEELCWGIQGPELSGRDDWRNEFSLSNFLFLWQRECERRGTAGPELVLRYPYLAGGKPATLPGIDELRALASDAAIVSTADPFHHGIGYGEPAATALAPDSGGLDLARRQIEEGLDLLAAGDYWGYNQHCVSAKSDARDAGQVLRYLRGPLQGQILDLAWSDTTALYNQPPPTWVAAALIELKQVQA